jgi:phage terminase large subunit
VFKPLLQPARYKCAWGGRASGKSHFFAELLIEAMITKTTRAVCIREVQKSIKESVKRLLEDKIESMGLSSQFEILETEIRHRFNCGFIIFQGMQNHTAESIKSLEGFDIAWCEEAQTLSNTSLALLRPTIRKDTSEMWFSWNPKSEDSAVDTTFRGDKKIDSIIVEANYLDNPFCPKVMKDEAEQDKIRDYDNYLHVWMGHYKRTLDGAIYAKEIRKLFEDKRVCRVLPIPGKPVDTFFDLGKRDHTAIWFAQLQMSEYRILSFYQNTGERLEHYAQVLRDSKFPLGTIWLPHDADQERIVGDTPAQAMRKLFPNIPVRVIPRMAKKNVGIEAVRRIFDNCYFDEERTKAGIKALGAFKYDVDPDTGGYSQNPLHDENSDAADAFAQLALSMRETAALSPTIMPGQYTQAYHHI